MSLNWWQAPCQPLDYVARSKAIARQQQLTKPAGSLGQLEAVVIQLAALQGRERPRLEQVAISIFAGDHGIVAEGISAFPQAVTGQMLRNFVNGGAAISVLAKQLSARLEVIDLGTVSPAEALPGVMRLQLGAGTQNFLHGPAMNNTQLGHALQTGRNSLQRAQLSGCELFIGGEMGIGNTTAATALACWLLQRPARELVGPGTGLNVQGVARKAEVIEAGLALHRPVLDEPLDALRALGGFEIAALVGAYLACAQQGCVALVDGFICSVAALLAVRVNPACREWLLFAHCGAEPGHQHVLQALQAQPLLDLGLRLGEGSGAALAVPLLQLACSLHNDMATFAEAAVAEVSA
ncbi:nicotinate-nucleotide--dimethylbenzimidazole phosphoribosyltransferase [Pseudomonas sp. SL4(2022)]|uniref:nicotinate-nucleotide--dimethylbenzimidazole phosphoribosyltransferase n=1 Tax=Pseudomonas sp. SL4(2022) TaxID=2994661 RepID=UPI00226D9976|nr:nicotinate-nucleotide--dimethylbenzimidazole phosphoribosyltransferase [Pseudomonas sp. SL4(2022)]WAC44343.1 nicotinate-nucleotide--dimethylbenzimidazole phosphoribosyltransferase [Pseudomonas sp. SL4(2022)]